MAFLKTHFFARPLKENCVPAPKKTENEAEKMEMSAAGEEMEVSELQTTFSYTTICSALSDFISGG